jgi:hypothetical protein
VLILIIYIIKASSNLFYIRDLITNEIEDQLVENIRKVPEEEWIRNKASAQTRMGHYQACGWSH